MKINWYGIWFDICLGTQCTELNYHTHIFKTSREEIGRRSMTGKFYG